MQNRGALWTFTILLAVACIYQLSFSYFTGRVEDKARAEAAHRTDSLFTATHEAGGDTVRLNRDSVFIAFENQYLRERSEDRIYPVLGYSYRECKEREINLGLDLKGGMAVTLEVSIPELVVNLSENSEDEAFRTAIASARERQKTSGGKDFITLFGEEYAKIPGRGPLSAIFYTPERKGTFEREGSDEDYLNALRREAATALDNTERIMRTRIDKFGVAQPSIQKQRFSGRIQIELPGVKDKERVRKVLQSTANLEFWETFDNEEIYPALDKANTQLAEKPGPDALGKDTVPATDTTATAEATDTTLTTAADTIPKDTVSEEPDEDVMSDAERARKNPLFSVLTPSLSMSRGGGYNLAKGPVVGYARLADTARVSALLNDPVVAAALPADARLAWGAKPEPLPLQGGGTVQVLNLYALKVPRGGKPKLDGSSIVYAKQDYSGKGEVEVSMRMNPEGAQIWKVMTGDNVNKSIAIVLDGTVYSAPNVLGEIPGGQSSITMGRGESLDRQIQEAEDLANILRAGALPAPARIIQETIVGPSLGAENIERGLTSSWVALIGVLLVMFVYYARAGWIADIALLANVFFLLGAMASMQATLTLPGIAGIVLTIGMAVDANVLINERVRDELKQGRMIKSALQSAYSNQGALSAILDSNITSFVTAVILYVFGSGPIRGFATTLGLGILTSLFTAIFIARMVTTWHLDRGKPITFWRSWNKDLFDNVNFDFMGKRKLFYVVSLVVIGAGVASMFTRKFNLGVDFTGGRTYTVEFRNDVDAEAARQTMTPFFKEGDREYTMGLKTYGSARQLKITTNYLIDDLTTDADSLVDARFKEALGALGNPFQVMETQKVDATISDDIKIKAITSVAIALAFMFIYIAVRFNKWQYGVGAVVSLAHDALILLGLYSLLWGVVGFSMEIDEAFIAVLLTVVGYSINDTVVVFDRIREYLRDHKRDPVVTVFNKATNSTLSRTLNTGLCTLLVLAIMFFFGGVSIKGFAFGLFVGTVVGTYSSIFTASGIAVDLWDKKVGQGAAFAVLVAFIVLINVLLHFVGEAGGAILKGSHLWTLLLPLVIAAFIVYATSLFKEKEGARLAA